MCQLRSQIFLAVSKEAFPDRSSRHCNYDYWPVWGGGGSFHMGAGGGGWREAGYDKVSNLLRQDYV